MINDSTIYNSNRRVPLISIILPTLNEEKSIQKVIEEIFKTQISNLEIIVVDGGSLDNTVRIARKMNVKAISIPSSRYGSAIKAGIRISSGKIVVTMDSDYTYPAKFIPNLIEPLLKDKTDMVLGNRLKRINTQSMNCIHIFGNQMISALFYIFYQKRIKDTQTGFRAFKKGVFEELKIKSGTVFFCTEMLIKALKSKLKIAEYPINYRPRIGSSKLSPLKDGLIILLKMILSRIF